jgi:hypothetical protein
MFTIKVRCGNRHLTINVPKGIDEVTLEVPSMGRDEEKPLIVLTDRL